MIRNRAERRRALSPLRGAVWDAFEPGPLRPGIVATWRNNAYSVQARECTTTIGTVYQLMIRRHDGKAIHSWQDLQRIRTELYPRCTAVEIYPPAEEVVDVANIYHLWILPADYHLPFGM